MNNSTWRWFLLTVIISASCGGLEADTVKSQSNSIPVMHEVDVVVVGGTAGGVEAALAAAKAGAQVFLIGSRPYLGEDICANQQLWLEPEDKPLTELSRTLFEPAELKQSILPAGRFAFTYTTDLVAAPRHADTRERSRLRDGTWRNASTESVEFGGTVSITADLGQSRELKQVILMAFQRPDDFVVGSFTVSTSEDGERWQLLGTRVNDLIDVGPREELPLPLVSVVSGKGRFVKLQVSPSPRAQRILLGEIIISADAPETIIRSEGPKPVMPMQVKLELDRALTAAKVPFLYPSVVTGLLQDREGQPAGIIMANRSGLQAVIAKVIIDATDRATVARMTPAQFTPYSTGPHVFRRVVVNGPARAGDQISRVPRHPPLTLVDRKGDLHTFLEYDLRLDMRAASFADFANAEQIARDLTWTRESSDASERLFQVPPDSFRSEKPQAGNWPGAEKLPLECLRPAGVKNVYVLGGCADVARETAAKLIRPANLMAVGNRLGTLAAQQARQLPTPQNVVAAASSNNISSPEAIRDVAVTNPSHTRNRTLAVTESAVPVWGDYDVVVVGGGTGGAPAAIAAGRSGAKTLLVEFLHELGGVGTAGLISKYYHGNRVGFTAEVDRGVNALAGGADTRTSSGGWSPNIKSEWYRREMRAAGVEIWYGAMGHGAVVNNGKVTGVVVATPMGRGVVRAKVVVDSTGNADIAAAAGAACRYTDDTEVAVQGTGLPPRELDARYVNTDYLFVDDTDIVDIWRAFVTSREKFQHNYDLGQLVDTRERRQIVGDHVLTPMDIYLTRTFPDTVVISRSDFDSHGYTVHPTFLLRPPHRESMDAHVPYRCLLPRGLDGILVTGLGISAHRDSLPIIRMQADIQNQGYAAGVAAAMVARDGIPTRDLNIKALQAQLVEKGNLPATVLTNQDSFPLPRARLVAAARSVVNNYEQLEVLLADVDQAKPLLREQLTQTQTHSNRLVYAHILGMLDDPAGAAILRDVVRNTPWDAGWDFRGGGQYGASLSPLDSYIIALGRTKDPAALPVLIEKANALTTNDSFSHFRAIALALETFQDRTAAKPLARLLQLEGMRGHALADLQSALNRQKVRRGEDRIRGRELAELGLARALYRSGDWEGLGERILREYAQSLQGHHARHAQAVLRGRQEERNF